jgi:hypothetical protein
VNSAERFALRRDPFWRPFLLPFGATASRSFVEIHNDELYVRYGWGFAKRFALSEITSVRKRDWPMYLGIGWRSNLLGLIGLTGSTKGVVEVMFRRRRWIWLVLLPLPMNRLAFSLEAPDEFVEALGNRLKP